MRILSALFRGLVFMGVMSLAVPWVLLLLALSVMIATVVGFFVLAFFRALFLEGVPPFADPTTPLGWIGYVLVFLVCWSTMIAIWADVTGVARWFSRNPGDSHGSARFASKAERKALQQGTGLLIGRDTETGRLLRYDGPAHLLTLAPTRSGKGVGTVLPNLLTLERSMLVVDPKGENARIAGDARQRFGQLHVLDPFGVTGMTASAYNPLDLLGADSPDLGEDAASLAEALVMDPPGQAADAHWNEEAKALLSGLIMFVVAHEEPERRTLATLREYLTLPPDRFRTLLGLMQDSDSAGGLIARAANRHCGKADREAAGVLSSAQRHTHFLDSPRIAAAMARSDFRFVTLRHEVTSVFLVLPPNRLDAYSRWLRLLVAQALQDIARDAEHGATPASGPAAAQEAPQAAHNAVGASQARARRLPASGPPHSPQATLQRLREPTLFLLDEFAALGRLEPVERAMGLMAGYGLQLWPILQDMSQLRDLYGARANTFVANAGVLQAFGVNDYETAKWLSQSIGQETTATRSDSYRPGEVTSTSYSATGRELLTPDEIMRLPGDLQLLRLQGKPTIVASKLRHHADREFRNLYTQDS